MPRNPGNASNATLDPAHWVQMQLQMHACGVYGAYLVSHTLTRGSIVFLTEYSPAFLQAAATVLARVYQLFIGPGSSMPRSSIEEAIASDLELKEAWHNLATILQREYKASATVFGAHLELFMTSW